MVKGLNADVQSGKIARREGGAKFCPWVPQSSRTDGLDTVDGDWSPGHQVGRIQLPLGFVVSLWAHFWSLPALELCPERVGLEPQLPLISGW